MSEMKKAILMNMKDNVATALSPISKGETAAVTHNSEVISEITALSDIERYHKIALGPIEAGELVYKYGEIIGRATLPIKAGEQVHVNNIESVMGK